MSREHNVDSDLKWYQRVALEILWAVCRMMNLAPYWFNFYVVRPFFYALLRLVRYRRKVVVENLANSFPEKSESKRRRIMRGSYWNLAEMIVCTMCLAGATPERNSNLITWSDGEEHIERVKGRDWVAMASHFVCWEYFLLWSWFAPNGTFLGVYHPLKSAVFEHFYRRLRNFSPRVVQVPMKETLRYYLRNRSEEGGIALGLISDQSPILRADTEWFRFLNQDTAFVDGGEKIASRFHIPAYFVDISRLAPGRYAVRFEEIYDGKEELPDGEITRRYARLLEAMIRRQPELWIWSHKRWKHTPEKQATKFGIEKKEVKQL